MSKIAIAIHGGAGPMNKFIREHREEYHKALEDAVNKGYGVLEAGGTATDAVEAAITFLEDCKLFNAGRGSAITQTGKIQMCASIMQGDNLNSGAVAIVENVKNPVKLARCVMEKSKHIYLGHEDAVKFAKKMDLELRPTPYFVAEHAYDEYLEAIHEKEKESGTKKQTEFAEHGTVGAVAIDRNGNIAAATSTGGSPGSIEGRIGDSSMIGVGCYANNKTCAVSSTGDGEYAIRGVICHDVSAYMEYKGGTLKEACQYIIHDKQSDIEGDLGLIAIDKDGNIEMAFNSDRMHRAWRKEGDKAHTEIE